MLAGSNFSGVDFGSTQFNGGTDFSAKFGLKENEPVRGATLQNSDFYVTKVSISDNDFLFDSAGEYFIYYRNN